MRRCFQLAKNGLGNTSPNPLVGAVIVHKGRIIGEGFHHHAGGLHAEIEAIQDVKIKSLLQHSTLFVNLEPCCHHGKTPPCTTAILKAQIPRVVVCNRDPNPDIEASRAILESGGVACTYGILDEEGSWLNRRFFTRITQNKPYVILKWAQSADRFIDINRKYQEKGIHWISAPRTQLLTHQWRAEEDAILIGVQTVINDNPSLTCRAVAGKNPLRIVIDPHARIKGNVQVCSNEVESVIFSLTNPSSFSQFQPLDQGEVLPQVLKYLSDKGINGLLVEGGKSTLEKFIKSGLWDEARVITGKSTLKDGLRAPDISGELLEEYKFGTDNIQIFKKL